MCFAAHIESLTSPVKVWAWPAPRTAVVEIATAATRTATFDFIFINDSPEGFLCDLLDTLANFAVKGFQDFNRAKVSQSIALVLWHKVQGHSNRLARLISRLFRNVYPKAGQADVPIRGLEEPVHVAVVKRVPSLELPLGRDFLGILRADPIDLEFSHAIEISLGHTELIADRSLG